MSRIPRRNQLDKFTPAEKAIYDSTLEVEKMAADPLLTDAVVLLGQARDKVADWVEADATKRLACLNRALNEKE